MSHEAKWVTGVCLPVDAGTTAGNLSRPNLQEDRLAQGFDYDGPEGSAIDSPVNSRSS